ncbi:MAG: hypothetical protein ABI442_08715 [Gemmatimonadaceae bacterium]
MAAGPQLDGAGIAKMKTLQEAIVLLQRVHGLVETYAVAVKNHQPTTAYATNIRRTLPTLAANLKGHFGLISDQVTAVNLASSRGANEGMKVRAMREGVAQVKQALEIAVVQTKDRHTPKHD